MTRIKRVYLYMKPVNFKLNMNCKQSTFYISDSQPGWRGTQGFREQIPAMLPIALIP